MDHQRDFNIVPIIAGVVVIIIATVVFVVLPNMLQPTTRLKLGDGIFNARIVSSESDRTKGLSGITKLDPNQALLIVFPDQEEWKIRTIDMKISIDIVWLNSDKKVVHVVKNAPPDYSMIETFSPGSPAKYVVELPAGTIDGKAITAKSVAVFQINNIGSVK